MRTPSPGPALTWGPTLAMPRGGVTLCIGPMLGCPEVGAEGRGLRPVTLPRVDMCWRRVVLHQEAAGTRYLELGS